MGPIVESMRVSVWRKRVRRDGVENGLYDGAVDLYQLLAFLSMGRGGVGEEGLERRGTYVENCIIITSKRPLRGKKNPSAKTLWISFTLDFCLCASRCCRFFSTSIRDEKVRTLSALGPDTASAALVASGWRDAWESCFVKLATGEFPSLSSLLYSASRVADNRLDGNEVSSEIAGRRKARASCSPFPASSRALRPSAVRIAERWICEISPSKYMAANQRPIFNGKATSRAIMLWSLYSWNLGRLLWSCNPTTVRATSSMFSVSSVPKPVLRLINEGALEMARL